MAKDAFLDSTVPLVPCNAVNALILIDGGYLLQQRDDLDFIFFPGHWGCFGGAIDDGESEIAALRRELLEEIGLDIEDVEKRYFSELRIDMTTLGRSWGHLFYYEVHLSTDHHRALTLGEGRQMRLFSGREALSLHPVSPFDRIVLWMHIQQTRLRPPMP